MKGIFGTKRGATPDILKGTTPIQADPSKVSISRPSGINRWSASCSILQCMKSKSCHCIRMDQPRSGSGHFLSLTVCFSNTFVIGHSFYFIRYRHLRHSVNRTKRDFFKFGSDFSMQKSWTVSQKAISSVPRKGYPENWC